MLPYPTRSQYTTAFTQAGAAPRSFSAAQSADFTPLQRITPPASTSWHGKRSLAALMLRMDEGAEASGSGEGGDEEGGGAATDEEAPQGRRRADDAV